MLRLTFSPPRASIRMEALLRRRPVVILCCLRDSLWFTLSLYCCWSVSRWSWIYQTIKTTTYPIDLYQIIELNEFSGLSRNNDWQILHFLKFIWKDLKEFLGPSYLLETLLFLGQTLLCQLKGLLGLLYPPLFWFYHLCREIFLDKKAKLYSKI